MRLKLNWSIRSFHTNSLFVLTDYKTANQPTINQSIKSGLFSCFHIYEEAGVRLLSSNSICNMRMCCHLLCNVESGSLTEFAEL